MKQFCLLTLILLFMTGPLHSQIALSEEQYRVFDAKGNPSTIAAVIERLDAVDVIFLGEQHDDAVGHAAQLDIFRRAIDTYLTKRKIALSLEMFERDVQIVLDEYLAGLISENHLILSSRAWTNYKTDYRPLVELAKEKKLPVIAANAPRRYVNMVSRNGRGALNGLSKDAKEWLAPLPFGEPSEAYAKKFRSLMGPSAEAQMGIENILASQSLWDATMADSIVRSLKKHDRPLVVHLNGSFHSENRLGAVDHLLRYRPKTRVLVVTIKYEDDFRSFDRAKHTDLGDFVLLTDAKQPRSRR
ncbi:MAG TPA: ChaN family lipoprotein [Pyrinomonadaceae bacterium]|nr:ChaN family lipoprotein [Pyrinomonadaceae bacterium]